MTADLRPTVTEVAERHRRTPAQVVLRWHLELGAVPIPKSSDGQRLRENLAVFDFELSSDEVRAISGLDRGEATAADSDEYGH